MDDIDQIDRQLADLCDVIVFSKGHISTGREQYVTRVAELARRCTMCRGNLINLIGSESHEAITIFLTRDDAVQLRSQFAVEGLPHRSIRLVPLWALKMLSRHLFDLSAVARGVLQMSADPGKSDISDYFLENGLFDMSAADDYLLYLIGRSGPHNAEFMTRFIMHRFSRNPHYFHTHLKTVAHIERCTKTISILAFLGVQTHLGHHRIDLAQMSEAYSRIANQSTHERIAFIGKWKSLTRLLEVPAQQQIGQPAL